MLSFSGSLRVFLAVEPCDMRKGYEGLTALASEVMKEDMRSGTLFVFGNRRRTRLKILSFDGTGLWLMSKQLEAEKAGKACASFSGEASRDKGERRACTARIPDDLPVEEIVIDPLEVQAAPEAFQCIGAEVSEQLDYTPGAFRKVRTVRRKHVAKEVQDAKPVIAPLPPKLQDACTAAPGLLAYIAVSRFVDHLPFYRQEQIFKTRQGVHIPRQNRVHWMEMIADRLEPIYNVISDQVLAGNYIQMDETPIRYLDPGNGKTQLGYLWVTGNPEGDNVFRWKTSRAAQCVKDILPPEFKGILQTDAYAAYGSFAKTRPEVTMAGCIAHVRRKFFQAREQSPGVANFILCHFAVLYPKKSDWTELTELTEFIERNLRKACNPLIR